MTVSTFLSSAIAGENRLQLILRLTLILLALHGASSVQLDVALKVACILGIAIPTFASSRILWTVLVGSLMSGNVGLWSNIDNHKYLITYWAMACLLSLCTAEPTAALRLASRGLLAGVFACAVFWKVWAGQFVDGSFFYWTFLTDGRLTNAASWLSGLTTGDVDTFGRSLKFVGSRATTGVELPVLASGPVWMAAKGMSWLGLAVETCVAVTHAAMPARLYRVRHATLLVFVVSTYFFLPVVAFAFVLAILGLAESDESDAELAALYVAAICVIQLAALPWQQLVWPAAPPSV